MSSHTPADQTRAKLAAARKLLIEQRREVIRRAWNTWAKDPLFLFFLADPDWAANDRKAISRKGISRWLKGPTRVALHDGGSLIAQDAVWNEVKSQLNYAPGILADRVPAGRWPGHLGALKNRYHIVVEGAEQDDPWNLRLSKVVTAKLVVSDQEECRFLGPTGGEHRTTP